MLVLLTSREDSTPSRKSASDHGLAHLGGFPDISEPRPMVTRSAAIRSSSCASAVGAASQRRLFMLGDRPVFPILLSTDMEASRAFYKDALGLELLREDVVDDELDRLVFRCGDGTQLIISHST